MQEHIKYFDHLETPLGVLGLASNAIHLTRLFLPGTSPTLKFSLPSNLIIDSAKEQLQAYFAGQLQIFTMPWKCWLPDFSLAVLHHLTTIPYGTTESYKAVAIAMNKPQAARAIGHACARNPLPIIIPCHRVVGSQGHLTGYTGGGLALKQRLIDQERLSIGKLSHH